MCVNNLFLCIPMVLSGQVSVIGLLSLTVTSFSCLITGEGDWEKSTSVAESEVPEILIQARLLHTKELWKVFSCGPYDFWSFCRGFKGS